MLGLANVYHEPQAEAILYELLAERTLAQSISHKAMPSYAEHEAFVRSRPYLAWYLMSDGDAYVGAIYLSKQREVGIFVFSAYRGKGYAQTAIRILRRLHPGPLLANVAPGNAPSHKFFQKLGGELIQFTYRLPDEPVGETPP